MSRRHRRHAFTLIEILIVVALFSLLGTLCVFQSIGAFDRSLSSLQNQDNLLKRQSDIGKELRHITVGTDP